MELRGEFLNEGTEIILRSIRNQFEVESNARVMARQRILVEGINEVLAGGGIGKHGCEGLRKKIGPVRILQQGHHGKFDAGGVQPVGEFWIRGDVETAR